MSTPAIGLQARAWCISQAGFTPEALAFAAEKGILVSKEREEHEVFDKLP